MCCCLVLLLLGACHASSATCFALIITAHAPTHQAQMYYDQKTGLYYANGRWYTVAADGQFVEWTGSG